MSLRVCSQPGCGTLVERAGRCPTHQAEYERLRGTPRQRGYTSEHERLRAKWKPRVAAGRVRCWRCKQLIAPDQPWDLGHDDTDRSRWNGPECIRCNRSAAGVRSHL